MHLEIFKGKKLMQKISQFSALLAINFCRQFAGRAHVYFFYTNIHFAGYHQTGNHFTKIVESNFDRYFDLVYHASMEIGPIDGAAFI